MMRSILTPGRKRISVKISSALLAGMPSKTLFMQIRAHRRHSAQDVRPRLRRAGKKPESCYSPGCEKHPEPACPDRKSVGEGKSGSVRCDLGWRRENKKK